MRREVGCTGVGKSLPLLEYIDTHISVARFYPHDSLFHVRCQVSTTNDMSRAELLKLTQCIIAPANIQHVGRITAGMREEFRTCRVHKHGVGWDAFCVRVVASGVLGTMQ